MKKPDLRLHKRKKAVAMRYKQGKDRAPKIVAKGQSKVAERIIETAKDHNVPIYEDPKLAEAISYVGLGDEVPENLYDIVAQVLSFVYQLDEKWRDRYL